MYLSSYRSLSVLVSSILPEAIIFHVCICVWLCRMNKQAIAKTGSKKKRAAAESRGLLLPLGAGARMLTATILVQMEEEMKGKEREIGELKLGR